MQPTVRVFRRVTGSGRIGEFEWRFDTLRDGWSFLVGTQAYDFFETIFWSNDFHYGDRDSNAADYMTVEEAEGFILGSMFKFKEWLLENKQR